MPTYCGVFDEAAGRMQGRDMIRAAVLLVLLTVSASIAAEDAVLVLDQSNFHDTIAKHDFIVVEFYAPWCGHCKRLEPEYEKAAAALKDHDPKIVLAKVNADEEKNKNLASEYDVRGYPTIKIIRNQGAPQEYKGPRDAEGIVAHLKKQAGPATSELKTVEEAGDFVGQSKIAIIGVFKSYESPEFKTFQSLAESLRSEYDFRHTLDAALLPLKDEPLAAPAIRLFKTFDERFNDFTDFDLEKLPKLIEEASLPIVTELSEDPEMQTFLMKFFNSPATKVYFFLEYNASNADEYRAAFKEVAAANRPKGLAFLLIDGSQNEHALQHFGLSSDKLPAILVQEPAGKKYVAEGVEASKLSSFIKDFLHGKLTEFVRSEPIPEKNDEPVKVVVRNSLEKDVLNSGKEVLLEFYAPWCGHCKKLVPVLEEVAVHFSSDPSVVIAKLDATANDVPAEIFDVKGFPTLYLYTSDKKVVSYDGDRSKADLIKFIQQNRAKAPDSTAEIESEAQSETKQPLKDEL